MILLPLRMKLRPYSAFLKQVILLALKMQSYFNSLGKLSKEIKHRFKD